MLKKSVRQTTNISWNNAANQDFDDVRGYGVVGRHKTCQNPLPG